MKPISVILLFCLGVLIVSSGCGGTASPDPGHGGGGGPDPCAPASLGAPGDLSPANKQVVSVNPTLKWKYPSNVPSPYPYPSGATGCGISGFQIYLLKYGDHVDLGGSAAGNANSFSPGTLEPATEYFWQVRVIVPGGHGPWSGFRAFFTGPICDTLAAPDAYYPEGQIADPWPHFYWHYPSTTCLPEGYRIDVSADSGFGDTSLSGGTGNPSTEWTTAHALENCIVYFWRVAGINGTTLGPWSETLSFEINPGGTCPTPTPVASIVHFTPNIYANCRYGPGTRYPLIFSVLPGTQTLALGRLQTEDGWYYFVRLPDQQECWLFERQGTLDGDASLIPVRMPPDLPTSPPGVNEPGQPACNLTPNSCSGRTPSFCQKSCSCVISPKYCN